MAILGGHYSALIGQAIAALRSFGGNPGVSASAPPSEEWDVAPFTAAKALARRQCLISPGRPTWADSSADSPGGGCGDDGAPTRASSLRSDKERIWAPWVLGASGRGPEESRSSSKIRTTYHPRT